MLKILIVEDETEKRRLIVEAILGVEGVTLNNIDTVSDGFNAKKRLKEKKYDLLVLDINIPPREDRPIRKDGGLDVINFIKRNRNAKQPHHVVGMTAYDEAFSEAEVEFSTLIWKLVKFSYADVEWRSSLQDSVQYLVENDIPPYTNDGTTFHFDVGIVCALEEELLAIRDLDANWEEVRIPYDHSSYFTAEFLTGDSKVTIVAVAAPHMGMPTAAVVATKLIATFRPGLVIMPGICAGVKGKTNFGDVLVADPCFDWGSGKWTTNDEGKLQFRPAAYQWRLDSSLNGVVSRLANSPEMLESIYNNYQNNKPDRAPSVIVDAMASGGSVLQAQALVEDVREQHKNLVGIEMESYSVFTACAYAAEPRPLCISMKSVCDFGDKDKEDDFHAYACYTSAQFLYQFILTFYES